MIRRASRRLQTCYSLQLSLSLQLDPRLMTGVLGDLAVALSSEHLLNKKGARLCPQEQ